MSLRPDIVDVPVLNALRIAVVLLKSGPQEGQIAVVVEIIDHNRVCLSYCKSKLLAHGARFYRLSSTAPPLVFPAKPSPTVTSASLLSSCHPFPVVPAPESFASIWRRTVRWRSGRSRRGHKNGRLSRSGGRSTTSSVSSSCSRRRRGEIRSARPLLRHLHESGLVTLLKPYTGICAFRTT